MLLTCWVSKKCAVTWIHHRSILQNSFTALKSLRYATYWSFPFSELLATSYLFTVVMIVPFPDVIGLESYSTYVDLQGFFSLTHMHLRVPHIFLWLDSLFLFINNIQMHKWIRGNSFAYGKASSWFPNLAIMNKTAINIYL